MMPLCVLLDTNGNLVSQGEFNGECTGYILETAADWAGSVTITKLFAYPDPVAFGSVFIAMFSLVLFLAGVASSIGEVAGFFSSTTQVEEL